MKLSAILFLFLSLFGFQQGMAHALWVETAPIGELGTLQTVKVYFAEVGDKWEPVTGKEWSLVKGFDLLIQSPSGKLSPLETTARDIFYEASFTPQEVGVYQVVLKNTSIKTLHFPNTPPFIPYFYATAKVQVGVSSTVASQFKLPLDLHYIQQAGQTKIDLELPDYANGKATVSVLFPSGEIKVFKDLKNGIQDIDLLTKGSYAVELQIKDERADQDYEFTFHTLTKQFKVD